MDIPHQQALLKWFNGLYSRTLDLVGDYAGNELFIIEGDSLLLHCFSDDQLDFAPGFQLLHATYLVERFLSQLHQRKCYFHITFFAEHADVCIPPNATAHTKQKYLVAREAILQHLTRHLPAAAPAIQVRSFPAYNSLEFRQYLSSVGAYFLMCHDGAFSGLELLKCQESRPDDLDGESSDMEEASPGSTCNLKGNSATGAWYTSIVLRKMIRWFVSNGYNIALISMLECRDTKIMVTILEGSARDAKQAYSIEGLDENEGPIMESTASNPAVELFHGNTLSTAPELCDVFLKISNTLIGHFTGSDCNLSQRELSLVYSIAAMFTTGNEDNRDILPARAMVLHVVIMSECRVHERSINVTKSSEGDSFLQRYVISLLHVITSQSWRFFASKTSAFCDAADMLDGRLFLQTYNLLKGQNEHPDINLSSLRRYEYLASLVKQVSGVDLELVPSIEPSRHDTATQHISISGLEHDGHSLQNKSMVSDRNAIPTVLPFTNPIMDRHLAPVSIEVDRSGKSELDSGTSRAFLELSHWHNHKRPLTHKIKIPLTTRQLSLFNRRDQWFMAEIRNYAASLTNPIGGILEPEVVIVKPSTATSQKSPKPGLSSSSQKQASGRKTELRCRKERAEKSTVRAQVEARQRNKQAEDEERHLKSWQNMLDTFQKESNKRKRYVKVNQYLKGASKEKRKAIEPEVLAYKVDILIRLWLDECTAGQKATSLHVVALVWHTILQIRSLKQGVTDSIAKCVNDTIRILGLPAIETPYQGNRPLSFPFLVLSSLKTDLSIELSPTDFQLTHAGPYLDRSMGSAPDSRVHDFEPDQWQREILDQIDARKSLFVVAPTSAGKTFISFYAMKQILEESDDGVLVYVAPTKALVNQIAAEVQARFSKKFSHEAGKSVWAIHTRDYRINNCTGCQILVTVPHILQIMLLAPSNAKSWSSRVKRIIFDEIHSIGQADDGAVWEQLLLLAPCPIIALSATVGNPQAFSNWLSLTQKANGHELRMIQHKTRYSDLRKYVYNAPSEFVFNGLSDPIQLASLGLDDSPNMAFMHPVASLIDRSRGMPDDLTLEPRDCLELWKSMERHKTQDFPLDERLRPSVALPSLVAKADVIQWESSLKATLCSWMKDSESPFDKVLNDLSANLQNRIPSALQRSSIEGQDLGSPRIVRASSLLDTTLPLICSLHEQGALPAILFNYDRSGCEELAYHLLMELEKAEDLWKKSSPVWERKIAGWQAWKKAEEKRSRVKQPDGKKSSNNQGGPLSKAERLQESASAESSLYESFDPEEPVSGFHLADMKSISRSDFEAYAAALGQRFISKWLIDGLKRGIGVHHSGLNRKYRQICEILFRKGYLRVVIATGTLALGINMPCKTVVFAGDSVFLTALGFRQAAGRAGRRGFDFLGNVVFQGIAYSKVCRLLSSKLPDLNGHFPITTSLVLRLFILLTESGQSPFAVKAVNSILSCPRIYLGGPEARHTVLHHLRFSIEYLRRNYLLDQRGTPLNFAGAVSHLYYTESSSFAFHALLSRGYFHSLCENVDRNPETVTRTLMLVMAHIFGRHHLPRKTIEFHKSAVKNSPSVVFLPPLPEAAASAIRSHNTSTLDIYAAYVTTFIKQNIKEPESTLPLTHLHQGGDKSPADICPTLPVLPPTLVNSAFVSLSGHRDTWTSISQLCKMVRSGVWLEQSVVPYVPISPEEDHAPLNAYLYDFFRHGNVHALEHANMVRKGDIWFVLNDFSLVLATIVTSFENFLKLAPNTDPDMLDTLGSGDAYEAALEERLFEEINTTPETSSGGHQKIGYANGQSNASVAIPPVKLKKSKVSESWDDELSDEDGSAQSHKDNTVMPKSEQTDSLNEVLEEQRLLKVLKGFKLLQTEFNDKFRAMWA